jgi:hypothetical protein
MDRSAYLEVSVCTATKPPDKIAPLPTVCPTRALITSKKRVESYIVLAVPIDAPTVTSVWRALKTPNKPDEARPFQVPPSILFASPAAESPKLKPLPIETTAAPNPENCVTHSPLENRERLPVTVPAAWGVVLDNWSVVRAAVPDRESA